MLRQCEDYAMLGRCSAGFTYAHFQNHLLGADQIVLIGAGTDGVDLRFAAPWEFIEENHLPGRFGLTSEHGIEMGKHIAGCGSVACQYADQICTSVCRILNEDKALNSVLVASQFQPKTGKGSLVLDRENGFGGAIDVLAPIFQMFQDHRADFFWPPGENRVRLIGHALKMEVKQNELSISKMYHDDRPELLLPFDKVRKMRMERDVWRNVELYHVELSHPNEQKCEHFGMVELYLREGHPDVANLTQSVLEAGLGFSHP